MLSNEYEITKCGKVLRNGNEVPTHVNEKGYVMANVVVDDEYKLMRVHRLVAIVHIPNPQNLPMVNHKDEDKSNNNDWNLEWCDNQYNTEYSLAKNYEFISPSGEVIEVFNLTKFCRDNNLKQATMHRVSRNKGKPARNGWRSFK